MEGPPGEVTFDTCHSSGHHPRRKKTAWGKNPLADRNPHIMGTQALGKINDLLQWITLACVEHRSGPSHAYPDVVEHNRFVAAVIPSLMRWNSIFFVHSPEGLRLSAYTLGKGGVPTTSGEGERQHGRNMITCQCWCRLGTALVRSHPPASMLCILLYRHT